MSVRQEGWPPLSTEPTYLIVSHIPVYQQPGGALLADRLWVIDLLAVQSHWPGLALVCPIVATSEGEPADLLRVPAGIRVHRLRTGRTNKARIALRGVASDLPRAVRLAHVVQVTAAGGRPPFGVFAAAWARVCGRVVVGVIESAPWNAESAVARAAGGRPGPLRRARSIFLDICVRAVMRLSHVRFATTQHYRQKYARGLCDVHVVAANWLPAGAGRQASELSSDWQRRMAEPRLQVGSFSRLVPEKGLTLLLEAVRTLKTESAPVDIRIFGEGPLAAEVAEVAKAAAEFNGGVRAYDMGVVAYGPDFFEAVRSMDVIVVPTLGDEQPRIIIDAASQGVPVLASAVVGVRELVEDGATAILVPVGDAHALADAIRHLQADKARLRDVGLAAWRALGDSDHSAMHLRRAAAVRRHLQH